MEALSGTHGFPALHQNLWAELRAMGAGKGLSRGFSRSSTVVRPGHKKSELNYMRKAHSAAGPCRAGSSRYLPRRPDRNATKDYAELSAPVSGLRLPAHRIRQVGCPSGAPSQSDSGRPHEGHLLRGAARSVRDMTPLNSGPLSSSHCGYILYSMRRVECPTCGIRVESVPWASGKRPITNAYTCLLAAWLGPSE